MEKEKEAKDRIEGVLFVPDWLIDWLMVWSREREREKGFLFFVFGNAGEGVGLGYNLFFSFFLSFFLNSWKKGRGSNASPLFAGKHTLFKIPRDSCWALLFYIYIFLSYFTSIIDCTVNYFHFLWNPPLVVMHAAIFFYFLFSMVKCN